MEIPEKNNYRVEWAKRKGDSELKIVKPHLIHKRTCLDIGGHIGATSIKYSDIFESVHTFEPIEYLYELLTRNTQNIHNIMRYNVAVSNKNGTVEIYENDKNSEINVVIHEDTKSLIDNRWNQFEHIKPKTVICKTIDSYGFKNVDFIKIDVERYTIPVLEGMIQTLTNNSPILQIEVDNISDINSRTNKILSPLGYKTFKKTSGDWFYKK